MRAWFAELDERIRRELAAIALIAAAVLLLVALYGDSAGAVGEFFERVLRGLFGRAAPLTAVLAGLGGVVLLVGRGLPGLRARAVGAGLALAAALIYAGGDAPDTTFTVAVRNGLAGHFGGVLGTTLHWLLVRAFGPVGRTLIMAALAVASVPLMLQLSLGSLASAGARRAGQAATGGARALKEFLLEPVDEDDGAGHAGAGQDSPPAGEEEGGAPDDQGAPPPRPYRLPPMSLLKKGRPQRQGAKDRKEVEARARHLEVTLENFGVKARVVGVQQGPAVTRFELEPATGVRVNRIQNLANDIALSMAATDVRIEAPIPGKSLVGIEVPNREISPVYLRDVIDTPEFKDNPSRLALALGRDIAGQPVVTTLEKMVHVLIAGATGSGKSVCVNAMLGALLFKAKPDEVKLLLIDPKVVELNLYNGIPHLLVPVVTDPKRAAAALGWAVREMERRYERFADTGVRDISRYNARADQEGEERLPYIVVVIDELADLMMVAPVDVEDAIQRLAQMARAAGIHLVVATQRPSVDVITGVIKANIPSRIAFAVSSQTDSRVILDMAGAEKLVGKGDMLFHPMGASKPIRVQGAYLSENELEEVLNYVRGQGRPDYQEEVLAATDRGEAEPVEGDDDLFPEAVRLVVEAGQASVSLLQRRLRVGYTRAGRLIDMMEERGFVGPHQGSKPRDVRLTMEEYWRLFTPEA